MTITRPRKVFLKASLHSAEPEGDSGCPLGPEILTWPGHANLWGSLCLTLGLSEPSLNGPSPVTTTFYCICPHVSVLTRCRCLIVESESHLLPQLQPAMEIVLWPPNLQAIPPGGRCPKCRISGTGIKGRAELSEDVSDFHLSCCPHPGPPDLPTWDTGQITPEHQGQKELRTLVGKWKPMSHRSWV